MLGAWLLTVLVFLAPKWIGGCQFFVFQGNPWDTFGYLESATVYATEPTRSSKPGPSRLWSEIHATAAVNLFVRPSVHILYALLSQFDLGMMPRLHDTFLVFSIAQCVPAVAFLPVSAVQT